MNWVGGDLNKEQLTISGWIIKCRQHGMATVVDSPSYPIPPSKIFWVLNGTVKNIFNVVVNSWKEKTGLMVFFFFLKRLD